MPSGPCKNIILVGLYYVTHTMQVFHYVYHSMHLTGQYNTLLGQVCHADHLYWCGSLKYVV